MAGREKWHLRFGVTPNCNYKCTYCNPEGYKHKENLPTKEVLEILEAVIANGIKRVHWTGGEPTLREDFMNLIKSAKELGYEKQIVTTNGYRLNNILEECIENGLTRVIVSLDTLKPERFFELTGRDLFYVVKEGLEMSVKNLESITKISAVTMKSTLPELKDFVDYVADINSKGYKGKLALKLNQFFPSNPAQLKIIGQEYWKKEFATKSEIMNALIEAGNVVPIPRDSIEGDNPTYNYYLVGKSEVQVGVLTLFSDKYPCGGCHKLRIQPTGNVSVCLNVETQPTLKGKTLNEKINIIKDVLDYRENKLDDDLPDRKHYRAQLGELRFGKLGEPVSMDYFYNLMHGIE